MKDYKRLTEKCGDCFRYCLKDHKSKIGEFNDYEAFFDYSMAVKRLGELEDKIESGELINVNELRTAQTTRELTEKEIEFFIKHNSEVRKKVAKECIKIVNSYLGTDQICRKIAESYGIEWEEKE